MGTILYTYNMMVLTNTILNTITNLLNPASNKVNTVKQTVTTAALSTNTGKKAIVDIKNTIRKSPIAHNIDKFGNEFINILNTIMEAKYYVVSRSMFFATIPMKIASKIINQLWKLIGGNPFKSIEYLSDDFAVIYGFGAAMESATRKLDDWDYNNKYKLRSKVPVVKELNRFIDEALKEFNYSMDIHPTSEKRSYQIRKTLIRELDKNKDLDPRIKTQLKEQILEICKNTEDIQKHNKIISDNKDQAIIIMKEILKETGGELDVDTIEASLLDRDYMDSDFTNRLFED